MVSFLVAHYRVVPQGFMWLNWCCGPSIIVSPLLFLLFMVSSSFSLLFDYWENFSLVSGWISIDKGDSRVLSWPASYVVG